MQALTVVVYGLFDRFSPEEAIKKLFEAVTNLFKSGGADALKQALTDIAEGGSLDPNSKFFDQHYDGMYAVALLCGGLGTLLWLYRSARLRELDGFVKTFTILPIILITGSSLPFVAAWVSEQIVEANKGLINYFSGSGSSSKVTIPLSPSDLGFVSSFFAWMAGKGLSLESQVLNSWLPAVLTIFLLALGLRWLGFLGDGIFVVTVGILLTILFGGTAIILVIGGLILAPAADGYLPNTALIIVATMVAAFSPLLVLAIYIKSGLTSKVRGVMESRLVSTQIQAVGGSTPSSGGIADRAYQVGMGALAGLVLAKAMGGGRPDGVGRTEHLRERGSSALASKAVAAAATKNPVTAIAYIGASKILKPSRKD